MNIVTTWPGAESLHFPVTVNESDGMQIAPPFEGHYDLAATTATTVANEVQASLIQEVEPIAITSSVALACTVLGTAAGYYVRGRRTRKAEAAIQRADAEAEVEAAADVYTERSVSHMAGSLVLNNLLANVDITEGGEETSVTVGGKASRVDRVAFDTSGNGSLRIEGPAARYIKASTLEGLSDFALGRWLQKKLNQRLGIEVVDESDVMKITASVPAGSNLAVRRVAGYVQASGSFGDVVAESANSESMVFDTVKSAEIVSGSSSVVTIGEIDGSLNAAVGFDSRVAVKRGSASPVNADLGSYGKLTVNAEARDVDVACGFDGRVQLASASGTVSLSAASYGQARVKDGEASSLRMDGGFDSRMSFGGSASNAQLTSKSYAQVSVGRIDGDLTVDGGFDSRTKIGTDSDIANTDVDLASYAQLDVKGHMDAGVVNIGFDGRVKVQSYGTKLRVNKGSYGRFTVVRPK